LVISATDFLKSILKRKTSKNIYVVLNGYDETDTNIENQQNKSLNIAFAGTIYPWHPIEFFLKVMNRLYEFDFKLLFYGTNQNAKIEKMLDKSFPFLKNKVSLYNKLPNLELLNKLKNADLLLLFNDYDLIGTKIYNYLSVKRKIIFCFLNDSEANKLKDKYYNISEKGFENKYPQVRILEKTNAGIIVKDQKHLIEVMKELFQEFETKGYIECNSKGIEKYSRKNQAEKLANLIKNKL
jgi:hypothetical protein